MTDLFRPPAENWQRLDPNFLKLRFLVLGISVPIWCLVLILPSFLWGPDWLWMAVAGLLVVWFAWRLWRLPRVVRRWGYAETDTDVYVTSGLMFRHFECVPYGRMQTVTMASGPLERLFGLATVSMVTASSQGSVTIPGLNEATAAQLRDRLIERGESLQAGI